MSEKQQLGRTAMGVALSRAAHTLYAEPPMYRDEWAIRLLDDDVRAMLEDRQDAVLQSLRLIRRFCRR